MAGVAQGQTQMEEMKHVPVRCKKEMSIKVEKSGISNDIMRSVLQK